MEARFTLLTTTTTSLQSNNDRLKLMLHRIQAENEILRATAFCSPTARHPPGFVDDPTLLPSTSRFNSTSRPLPHAPKLDPTRLANRLLSAESSSSPVKTSSSPGSSGSQLLSTRATWDLLQSHPLYLSGAVDIGEVCARLKKMARCSGRGPVFEGDAVRKIIEEVGRIGGDELR